MMLSTTAFRLSRTAQRRCFSSLKAYPQYTVYGEDALMSMRPIQPTFRVIKASQTLALENKGRMLFEFVPRGSSCTL